MKTTMPSNPIFIIAATLLLAPGLSTMGCSGDVTTGDGETGYDPVSTEGCATPVQDAVDTASWPEIFIGTTADGCSDGEGAGTASVPFCNPHLAMASVTTAKTIVTFLDGVYRLSEFHRSDGTTGGVSLPRVSSSTAGEFVVIRAAANARPVLVGSVPLSGDWTEYSQSPRVFRTSVSGLSNDVRGLWLLDGELGLDTPVRRPRHVTMSIDGTRSHADVANLADDDETGFAETSMTESAENRDFTWTKADESGTSCSDANDGCYVYLRIDDTAIDPGTLTFEAGQSAAMGGGSHYMVIDGLHTRFTQAPSGQNSSAWFEGLDHVLIQNASFGHIANSNENAYALGIWFSQGSIIRNNQFFDAAYWGGTPNSKGLTFMCGGQIEPNWACGNEIFHIPGDAGIGSKGGEENLRVIGNYLHDCQTCVQVSEHRDQDGEAYPGGGWQIQQNVFQRCHTGVMLGTGHEPPETDAPHLIINNLFLDNFAGVRATQRMKAGSGVHNNVFLGGALANSCDAYGTCGAGVYFSNGSGDVLDFDFVLDTLGLKLSHNLYFDLTSSHGANRNWTPNFVVYTLDEFRSAWSALNPEEGSLDADPQLDADNGYRPLPGSPVIGAGDGSFYDTAPVNIGPHPF